MAARAVDAPWNASLAKETSGVRTACTSESALGTQTPVMGALRSASMYESAVGGAMRAVSSTKLRGQRCD